jgi:hypothetical protein
MGLIKTSVGYNPESFQSWLETIFIDEKINLETTEVRINDQELEDKGAKSPAIFVYRAGTRDHKVNSCANSYTEQMVAFIVAVDQCGCSARSIAANISTTLAVNLSFYNDESRVVVVDSSIRTSNTTSQETEQMGLSLWATSWDQTINLKRNHYAV